MKITEKVIKLDCTKGSYAYAVVEKDGVTLIDTSLPGKGEAILAELAQNGINSNKIKRILLTHHDIDHIGNAAFFQEKCGCEIYIHENDYPYVMDGKKREGIKKILGFMMKVQKPRTIKQIKGGKIGGFTAIPAHGHTRGHTVYRFDDVLFLGDLVASKAGKITKAPPIMNWNKVAAEQSIKALSVDGVEWLCMAHGEPVKSSAWREFVK